MAKKNSKLATMLFDIDNYCLKDEDGKYFLYCNFYKHKGFGKKDEAEECIKKKCWYSSIHRENEIGRE